MKRKHAELIKAWADGAEIERDYDNGNDNIGDWEVEHNPSWRDDMTYRIKPAEQLTPTDIIDPILNLEDIKWV